MIVLTPASGPALTLPSTFHWEDEAQWCAVAQSQQYLLPDEGGACALLIKQSRRAAGRPITLAGMLRRSDLLALRALADTAPPLTLTMGGQPARTVRFDLKSGAAVAFQPTGEGREQPGDDTLYSGKIKLIEVNE